MKITPSKIKNFLEKPNNLKGVLIHGNDHDTIYFFVEKIIITLSEYSVQIIDFEVVNKLPTLLFSQLANASILCNRKLIKLINVNGNISKELKNLLSHNINDDYVIMVANNLPYNSETKNYIEKSKIFGLITCYRDNNRDLYKILSDFFKRNDIKCKTEVIDSLHLYFTNSKLPMYPELQKLILYLGKRKNLELTDVELCFSSGFHNNYFTLDNLCSAVANRDIKSFIKISDTLILQENFSSVALTRIIQNYFLRLERVLLLIENGMSEQAAINQLNPPLFFNQLKSFKLHLKKFQLLEIKNYLKRLINLEVICKNTDLDHQMIFQHTIQMLYYN